MHPRDFELQHRQEVDGALGRRVAQVPGERSKSVHHKWLPRVPRIWAPGKARTHPRHQPADR